MTTRRDRLALVGFFAAVAAVAAVGALSASRAASTYAALHGPVWAPPAWLFGPVWSALYACIAVAGWLAWRAGPDVAPGAMGVYWSQLVLNAAWSPLFFALQWRGAALVCIVALDVAVVATVVLFWRRRRWAGVLMAPYLLWILFATALNGAYWAMNH